MKLLTLQSEINNQFIIFELICNLVLCCSSETKYLLRGPSRIIHADAIDMYQNLATLFNSAANSLVSSKSVVGFTNIR